MKRWLVLPIAVISLLFISAAPALADEGEGGGGDNQGGDNQGGDHQGNTTHFGPFASSSTDSGTCGPDWANDTFNRSFTVSPNADGSFAVREDFTKGKFTTIAGMSPGACNTAPAPGNGSLVRAGVTGRFHGYLDGLVLGATFFHENGCDSGGCDTTTGFLLHVFGPSATYTCFNAAGACTFFFTYRASDQGLIAHHWINASLDRGGNSGDIASS
ncbi:MAG TPA: hypothetical protein VGU71_14550 [Candidatus Dormibacteraeota bacterium]|nr:hypothetical protein [Candidatus Dormibacteraeota bacterium]